MNDDLTKTTKPNPNLIPSSTQPKTDLSMHPDAIAAGLGSTPVSTAAQKPEPNLENNLNSKAQKKQKKSAAQWFRELSKKQKILLIVTILLLIGGGTVSALLLNKQAPAPAQQAAIEKPVKTTEPSKLTGVEVKPELNKRSVTAVMIENSLDARPQSGLASAGVVFEAIAEGGITRFLTLFQEDQPKNLGPVRSVRPYYVDWLQGFDASVAHVGGSAEALAMIKSQQVKDLDQFFNPVAYRRDSGRFAPHNMYTSTKELDKLKAAKGFKSTNFDGFPRKKEKPATTPTATKIDFNISGPSFNPHYDYIKKTNSYARTLAGTPHIDLNTKKQISTKVVVAMVMDYGIAANGVNSRYNSIGKGKVYIFQDGNVTTGTWEKTARKKQISFKDAKGKTIELNPGNTWISAVGAMANVTYK